MKSFMSQKSSLTCFVVGLSSLLLLSCHPQSHQSDRAGIDPAPQAQAAPHIVQSFQVQDQVTAKKMSDSVGLQIDQAHVQIQKSALNKEFLLSVNMLSQTPTPMFSSQQSRVVTFIERDQKIYMLDVTQTNTVGVNNIPQNLLLAEFNILSSTDLAYTIDFNQGMKQIFTAGDMFSSDDASYAGSAQYNLPIAQVHISYLDEVKLDETDESLFIRQVAQVESVTDKEHKAVPVEVRYQIKPYLPDVDFVPVKSPGFTKVGFFEANPITLPDGSTRLYSMKWNEKKPMVFAVSANTPSQYRDLVKSAVLYWNKILGENKIQVIQLEDKSITAPSFKYNIIQWADWETAGYAYADAHVDPRSGQVLSAQVFFPSAFINANVAKRIRLAQGALSETSQVGSMQVGLRGFSSARFCRRNLVKDLASQADVAGVSDAAMDKAMRDYVFEVIAHEVGHVLGLRHNFAGNLVANYDFSDRPRLMMNYYKNQKAPEGIVDSSSVMEYSRFEESSWNGDILRRSDTKALVYDDMAISYLYLNKALPAERPPFCTDSQIATYADCNMSDAGRSVVSSSLGMYQFNLDSLAARLVNLYISKTKLADDSGIDLKPVQAVDLNAASIAKTLGIDLAKLISLMKEKTQFIAVRYGQDYQRSQDEISVSKMELDYLQNEVNRFGGLPHVLTPLPVDFEVQLQKKFASLLENPDFNSGVLADGSPYKFSDDEKKVMKEQVASFASQIKEQLILNEIKALSGESFSFESTYGQSAPADALKWVDSALTEQLAVVLLERLNLYTFSQATTKIATDILLKDGTHKQVELPTYIYSDKIRLAAAGLLANGHEAIDWGYVQKLKASAAIDESLSLLGDEDKLDKSSLNKETLKWMLINKKIQDTITN